jgi:hypothetical protein
MLPPPLLFCVMFCALSLNNHKKIVKLVLVLVFFGRLK